MIYLNSPQYGASYTFVKAEFPPKLKILAKLYIQLKKKKSKEKNSLGPGG